MKRSTVSATLDSLEAVAEFVMAAAAAAGLDKRASYRLRLAVDEVMPVHVNLDVAAGIEISLANVRCC